MLSAIKFGTAQFLTSNPPANTVCLALDFDDKKLYMITSEHKVLLSELMTAHLLDENGKIKQEYLDNGSVVEVPTKTSQLENDSGFITKDTKSLKYYLTKDATLAEINKSVVSLTEDMNNNVAYLNTKIEQETVKLQRQIDGLSGSYVYIGKIDNVNPTQDELTQTAIQLKGEVKVGYVIVDESQREWYFDGSVWNDFGTVSSEITWDAIQDKPKLVEYTEYPEHDKTASITLTNNNAVFGTDTNGAIYNLAMVSKWNKADFGSSSLEFNINAKDGIATINDSKVIATVDQIPEIPDMTKVVKYQAIGQKTDAITLKNDQNLLGEGTDGALYNLAMVSRWNKADFGSASLELNLNAVSGIVTINDSKVVATTDQIPTDYVKEESIADVVRFQNLSDIKNKSIVLNNDQAVFGTGTTGATYNLVMVSRWDKADFGSSAISFNINSKDGVATINDDKVIATTSDVEAVKAEATAIATEEATNAVKEFVGTDDDITNTLSAITTLSSKIENI